MAKDIIYRKDYKSPDFLIDNVYFEFDLDSEKTLVKSRIEFKKGNVDAKDCVLLADDLTFISVSMNGDLMSVDDYTLSDKDLVIKNAPDEFILEVENSINPKENIRLEGLYSSGGNLCSQCEPEGFRRIAYYPDRSDVMAKFKVKLIADENQYPILLSNGNKIEEGKLEDGKHYALFEDPFKKPSYLFAIIAGTFDILQDSFTTMSGKDVSLNIYCNPGNIDKCHHAMGALKKAMKWDEETFGREYDLSIFNIVVVDDFNAGAMENKSLNVFNSVAALADPKTATDANYQRIAVTVGHEYFHNWSGDRVTCQSWFELTLKEGLTVFRHQEFNCDIGDRNTARIGDVSFLRNFQLPEDLSPMAHPIRPESYAEINNFYTQTVYEKGAEIIRMMQTLLGKDDFRKATDLYFSKFDGKAVTCDDFVSCIEEVSGKDLTQFKLWYSQAGTPVVKSVSVWDKQNRTYTIEVSQSTSPTNGQEEKSNLYIPIKLAILDHQGDEMELVLNGKKLGKETTLTLISEKETFIFEEVNSQPALSMFRGCSAPVIWKSDLSMDDYAFLMQFDKDGVNRWDSAQKFAMHIMLEGVKNPDEFEVSHLFIESFKAVLLDDEIDDEFKALMLRLPSEVEISNNCKTIYPDIIHDIRSRLISELSIKLNHEFTEVFGKTSSKDSYDTSHESIARRSLHNICLSYLCAHKARGALLMAEAQYFHADNMTDQFEAIKVLTNYAEPATSKTILDNFYDIYKDDANVINKWFLAQAIADNDNILEDMKQLKEHEAFSITNPNNIRCLLGAFARGNPVGLHKVDGSGYKFLSDCIIELNTINPHVASDLIDYLCAFNNYDENRKAMMVSELKRVQNIDALSSNLAEKIDNALKTV